MNTLFVKMPSDFFSREKRMAFFVLLGSSVLLALLLQGCSKDNGFHLRNSVELLPQYKSVSLQNLPVENDFKDVFEEALEDAGGSLIAEGEASAAAKSIIRFKDFKEGKRVIAYTSERKAREYLLYLKFDYEVSIIDGNAVAGSSSDGKKNKEKKLSVRRINIDKSYLYDPDFALGKAEEEKLVKKELYQEASRLILLRLQYSK